MKKEYQEHIEEFDAEAYFIFCNDVIPKSEWGNKKLAERYLEKYWLSESDYNNSWKVLHHSIFDLKKYLPEMIFKKDFEFITLLGGSMFAQKDYEQLMACLVHTEDRYFVIVENSFGLKVNSPSYAGSTKDPLFRMKYPSQTSWEEMISGNYISAALVDNSVKEYYLFGDSGQWGMYAANDYWDPINIIGFNPKYRKIFRETFEIPKGEYCENLDYIPISEKEEGLNVEIKRPNLKEQVPKLYRN